MKCGRLAGLMGWMGASGWLNGLGDGWVGWLAISSVGTRRRLVGDAETAG